MGNWAVVNDTNNIVENIILWDGESTWSGPEGYTCIDLTDHPGVGADWTYDSETQAFTPPSEVPEPEAEPTLADALARVTPLETTLTRMKPTDTDKTDYAAATTAARKLAIVARLLGLS